MTNSDFHRSADIANAVEAVLEDEVYYNKISGEYDYGDAVKRIMALIPDAAQPTRETIYAAAKEGNLEYWRASARQRSSFDAWVAGGCEGDCPQECNGSIVDYITNAVHAALAAQSPAAPVVHHINGPFASPVETIETGPVTVNEYEDSLAAPVETGCTSSDGGGESRPASTEPQASASRRPQGLIGGAGVAPSPSDHQCSAGNDGVVRLLTKIADLIDNEDACDPLDDAIRYAKEALAILNQSPESGEWQIQESVPSDGFECYYLLRGGITVAEICGRQSDQRTRQLRDLVTAANRAEPQTVPEPISANAETAPQSEIMGWKAEAERRFGPIPDGGGENARLIAGYHYAFVEGTKAALALSRPHLSREGK